MQPVVDYLESHAERFVEELKDFLRIPSISADPAYREDMQRAADFVQRQLVEAGCDAEIVATEGHPIVFGSWTKAAGAPTALVYGHYDVQPADPLDQWITPPFEPTIRDGRIYARGATDDKGQFFTHVKSAEAWLKTLGSLPVNVKYVIEGEEEVGSNHLENFLADNRDKVACDVAVVSDTSQFGPGLPAVTHALRGVLSCEIALQGPSQDLHSGTFGGSIANPVNALADMVAALHDSDGRIQIPGFYDDVVPLSAEERESLADLPFDEASYLEEIGVSSAWGEAGYSTTERRWARPTCDVNGLYGGYTGEGPKTIVPARATAKITCRLVPNQDADKLTEALREFLQSRMRPGLTMEFKAYHGCSAVGSATDTPYMAAAKSSIAKAFGVEPLMIREGGSIPVVSTFRDVLGVDTLLLGWGQNTDNLHSPNEHFSLADFGRGTLASAHLWQELAAAAT